MGKYIVYMIFFLIYSGFSFPAFADPDLTVCQACHNTDGNSNVDNWPKIAGLPKSYIIKQLQEFRKGQDGNRFDPSMYDITKVLTDQQIFEYADFYSSQKVSTGKTKNNLLSLGKKIYLSGNMQNKVAACIACHGASGGGNALANFPPLAGQNPGYIDSQLKKYALGERSTDQNAIMRDISVKLTDEEIEAVSSYVAGLY